MNATWQRVCAEIQLYSLLRTEILVSKKKKQKAKQGLRVDCYLFGFSKNLGSGTDLNPRHLEATTPSIDRV